MNPLFFLKDIGAGLIALTWQQLQAVWTHSRRCDLVVATWPLGILSPGRSPMPATAPI
ncbi:MULTISPECIES: hypothetical protein [unclassified Microcoleus]